MDYIYRPVYNRLMRTASWDKSYNVIMSWDFDYIAPCHGDPISEAGKEVLAKHLMKD